MRAGGMKTDYIMLRADYRAEPAFRLDADDDRFQHVAPARARGFRECENRGNNRRRGMPAHRHVRIVEIERVAGRAVDQRCGQPRRAFRPPDETRFR